jgi:hypothetical protein
MSRNCKTCRGATLRFLLTVATFAVSLVALTGIPQAAAQNAPTLSRTITVTSDPPGATVWKKEGTTLTCMDNVTPGTVEFKFRGANDSQRIRLRKFGYFGKNLDVKPTDDKVNAALGDPAVGSFLVSDDAKPELKQLNDGLEKEFQKTIFADPEALRCAPFELHDVHVLDDEGDLTLGMSVILDRSFGGPAFRVAGHKPSPDERRQKMAQITLENGIADLLAHIHRIAAKFPNLKVITVVCFYPTTEAFLETRTINTMSRQLVVVSTGRFNTNAITRTTGQEWRTTYGRSEITEVEDRAVETIIKFVMPAAQIPDTTDKKTVTDAVLANARISLTKSSDGAPKPPSSPR